MVSAVAAIGGKALFGAAATIGGALLGSRSSSKASQAAQAGQDQALAATQRAAAQGRQDVIGGFDAAEAGRQRGFSSAADFIGGNIGTQIQPFQQGNVGAQQQIARGLPQIQNAILGLPTDLSGFQARQIGQPSDFNIANPFAQPEQPAAQPQFQFSPQVNQSIQGALSNLNIGGFGSSGLQNRFANFNVQGSN